MVGHFNNSDSCAQEQPLIAPIATTCVLTTTADGTKKKVRLNTKVEYMDVDDGSDMDSVGSPDLDKLDGDGDYVCPYDSDDSDSEEDDTTANPITESNLGINSDKTTTDTDSDEMKDELHIMYDLQVGTGDEDCDDADKFVDEDKRFLLGFELHHFNLGTDTGTDTINLPMDETTSDEMDLHNNLAMGLVNALRNSSTKSDKQKGKQLRAELKIRMSDKPSMQKITKRKPKNKKLGKTRKKSSSKKEPKQKTKVRKNHRCSRKQNPVAIDVDTVGGKSNIEIVSTVD